VVGSFPDHRRWTVFHLPSTPGVTGAVGWATSGGIRADDGELMRPELKQGARAGRHPTRPLALLEDKGQAAGRRRCAPFVTTTGQVVASLLSELKHRGGQFFCPVTGRPSSSP